MFQPKEVSEAKPPGRAVWLEPVGDGRNGGEKAGEVGQGLVDQGRVRGTFFSTGHLSVLSVCLHVCQYGVMDSYSILCIII